MSADLAGWLLEQLDIDEASANAAAAKSGADWTMVDGEFEGGYVTGTADIGNPRAYRGDLELWDTEGGFLVAFKETSAHIASHDPAHVLADIAAKRKLIDLHSDDREHSCPTDEGNEYFGYMNGWAEEKDHPQRCPTLRLLAEPYSDRPGYQEATR